MLVRFAFRWNWKALCFAAFDAFSAELASNSAEKAMLRATVKAPACNFTLKMEVEASVARCLRTPPDGAYPVRTLRTVFQTALRGLGHRSIVVVCNYESAR